MKSINGYHVYFKYNKYLLTRTNINKLDDIDCRNDDSIIKAALTKYELLNGRNCKIYNYSCGTFRYVSIFIKWLIPIKKRKQNETNNF